MAYASVDDMVARFGEVEMIRLSTQDGQPMDTVNAEPIELALADASDMIDTYCARRYATPLVAAPSSIVLATCRLARFDLAESGDRHASEAVQRAAKETKDWLRLVADGKVNLPLDEVTAGDQSNAQMSDRGAVFGPGVTGNVVSGNQPYGNSDQGLYGTGCGLRPTCDQGLPGAFDGSP